MSHFSEMVAAQWYADLNFLVNALLTTHPDPFTITSRSDFERGVEELRSQIPALPGYAVVVGLKKVLASIHDGHTGLAVSEIPGFRRYPIKLYLYSDGLYVQAASE